MNKQRLTRTRAIVGPGLTKIMNASGHPAGSAIPKTKAEFARLVATAETELRPARQGRPPTGQRRASTRTRSIRAPVALWKRLDSVAKSKGVSANQAAVLAIRALLTH